MGSIGLEKRPGVLVGLVLVLSWQYAVAQDGAGAKVKLAEIVQKHLDEHRLPAIWAGKFSQGQPAVMFASGVRKWGSDEAVKVDDRIHLGSCTKAMTAVLIGQLCSENKLKLETTLGEVFSDLPQFKESTWGNVRLIDLMRHRSGAPANMTYQTYDTRQPNDVALARQMLLEDLIKKRRPKRERFEYSNVGYIVLGHVVERVEGKPWEEVIQQRLFEPLKITSAGFGPVGKPDGRPADAEPLPDRAWGHSREINLLSITQELLGNSGEVKWTPLQIDNMPCVGPAGRAHMSIEDWSKFVMAFVEDKGYERLAINATVWRDMFQAADGASEDERYAAGWVLFDQPEYNGPSLFHNGSNTSWYCYATVAPGKKHCLLVATNAFSDLAMKACDDIARLMNENNVE